jgi:tetratricopeptide (TPR) repeat protein
MVGRVSADAPPHAAQPLREVIGVFAPPCPIPDSLAPTTGAWTAFGLGVHEERARLYTAALAYYDEAERLSPGEPQILIRRAACLLEMRKAVQALALADRALAGDSLEAEALWIKGAALVALGRNEEAVGPLRKSAELRPDRRTQHTLVNVLEMLKRNEEALEPLGALIQTNPTMIRLRERRARMLVLLGRVEQALEDYLAILEQAPEHPGLLEHVEALLARPELRGERTRFLRDLLDQYPERSKLRWKLVKTLITDERWEDAEAQLQLLRDQDPDDPLAILQLGLVAYRKGDMGGAFASLEEASRLAPALPMILRWKMRIRFAEGQLDSALASATRVLVAEPRAVDACKIRAICLAEFDRDDEALAAMRHWAIITAEDPEPLVLGAALLRRRGEWEAGLAMMREAVRRAPENPDLLIELVSFLSETDASGEAEEILRGMLERRPDHSVALNALGYMFAARGVNLEEAEVLIRRAVELDPENAAILDSMGWLWYKRGELHEAEKWLKKAIRKGGRHPEIFSHLAQVQVERREWKKAVRTLERGLESNPQDPSLSDFLRMLKEEGPRFPAGQEPR